MLRSKPTLHDRLCLLVVRSAKRGKSQLNQVATTEFYEHFFQSDHAQQYQQDLRFTLRHQEISRILRRIPVHGRVLDLGCGVGHILRLFSPVTRVFGCDYAFSPLQIARQAVPTAHLLNCSGYAMAFADSSFDVVTCLEVLEHLEDDSAAVAEIARVLKPGGWLIASVPSTYYFPEYRNLMGHFRHYTPESFTALIEKHGLKVCEYLRDYRRFNVAYFYAYVAFEALNRAYSRITKKSGTIYSRRLPVFGARLYSDLFAPVFSQLRRLDEGISRKTTFITAQNVGK